MMQQRLIMKITVNNDKVTNNTENRARCLRQKNIVR